MATIPSRRITETGLAGSLTTCNTGGDNFFNTGVEFVRIQNDHGSADYTVTLAPVVTSVRTAAHGQLIKASTTASVNNGECAYVGPFKQGVWNSTEHKVSMTYTNNSGGGAIGTGSHGLQVEILYLDIK